MKSILAALGLIVAILFCPTVNASHLFVQSGLDPVGLLSGDGVEVSMDSVGSISFAVGPLFTIQMYFDTEFTSINNSIHTGLASNLFSSGDVLRLTLGGASKIYDFDNLVSSASASVSTFDQLLFDSALATDSQFNPFGSALVQGNTFTLELLAGDGVRFDGFVFREFDGTTFTEATAGINTVISPLGKIPEPATIALIGLGLFSLGRNRR